VPCLPRSYPRAGQEVLTVQGVMPNHKHFTQACADSTGFSLHAAVRGKADDRQTLERLCRYITRPVLANERVQTNAAGQVVLKLEDSPARRPCRSPGRCGHCPSHQRHGPRRRGRHSRCARSWVTIGGVGRPESGARKVASA